MFRLTYKIQFIFLGGRISEAEVRQKQQINLMQSKYQQKVRKNESDFSVIQERLFLVTVSL